jgi:hypothetical protein
MVTDLIFVCMVQLCHVLISCLISKSPNTVTNSRILGHKHLSRSTDYPSQPINRPFSLSGLSTPPMCQREDTIGIQTDTLQEPWADSSKWLGERGS